MHLALRWPQGSVNWAWNVALEKKAGESGGELLAAAFRSVWLPRTLLPSGGQTREAAILESPSCVFSLEHELLCNLRSSMAPVFADGCEVSMRFCNTPASHRLRRRPDNNPSPEYPSLRLLHIIAVWVALSIEQTLISLFYKQTLKGRVSRVGDYWQAQLPPRKPPGNPTVLRSEFWLC